MFGGRHRASRLTAKASPGRTESVNVLITGKRTWEVVTMTHVDVACPLRVVCRRHWVELPFMVLPL